MEGEKLRKSTRKTGFGREKGDSAEEIHGGEESHEDNGETGQANEASSDMQAIYNEIRALRSDLKSDMSEFRHSFREDMRVELNEFRGEINQKLEKATSDLHATKARVTEAEQRISEIEDWDVAAKEALIQALENQETLQAKLTDLEARSRRNNLRIYGIPEESEGTNLLEFVTRLIKSEVGLPLTDLDLGIQRCHRALASKPPHDAPPRSVVICFQEFRVKEQVMHTAWRKKDVRCAGKRIYFDQDYPPEILKKRKAYAGILRVLKAKGIRFRTPHPAKLKVFFDSGTQNYESAAEAAEDLKKRGFALESITEPGPTAAARDLRRPATWEKAGGDRRRRTADRERIRERLRSFQRTPPGSSGAGE